MTQTEGILEAFWRRFGCGKHTLACSSRASGTVTSYPHTSLTRPCGTTPLAQALLKQISARKQELQQHAALRRSVCGSATAAAAGGKARGPLPRRDVHAARRAAGPQRSHSPEPPLRTPHHEPAPRERRCQGYRPPHRKSAGAARSARPPAPPAQHAPRARSRAPPAPSGAGAQVRPGAGRRAPRREEGGKGAGGERESARPDGSEAPAARAALTGKRLATEAGEGPRRGRMRGGRGRFRVPPRERAAQAHRPQGGRCGRGRSVGRGRGGACAGRATRPTHKMAGVKRSLGGSVTALCATCCRASPPSQ